MQESTEQPAKRLKPAQLRSCAPCAAAKRTCDHNVPCGRCVRLDLQCVVLVDRRRRKRETTLPDAGLHTAEYAALVLGKRSLSETGDGSGTADGITSSPSSTQLSADVHAADSGLQGRPSRSSPSHLLTTSQPNSSSTLSAASSLGSSLLRTPGGPHPPGNKANGGSTSQVRSGGHALQQGRLAGGIAGAGRVPAPRGTASASTPQPSEILAEMIRLTVDEGLPSVHIIPALLYPDYQQRLQLVREACGGMTSTDAAHDAAVGHGASDGADGRGELHAGASSASADSTTGTATSASDPSNEDSPRLSELLSLDPISASDAMCRAYMAASNVPMFRTLFEDGDAANDDVDGHGSEETLRQAAASRDASASSASSSSSSAAPPPTRIRFLKPASICCNRARLALTAATKNRTLPQPGRLAHVNVSLGRFANPVHPADRKQHITELAKDIMLRQPVSRSSPFRAYYGMGMVRVIELREISYFQSGCVRAITTSLLQVVPVMEDTAAAAVYTAAAAAPSGRVATAAGALASASRAAAALAPALHLGSSVSAAGAGGAAASAAVDDDAEAAVALAHIAEWHTRFHHVKTHKGTDGHSVIVHDDALKADASAAGGPKAGAGSDAAAAAAPGAQSNSGSMSQAAPTNRAHRGAAASMPDGLHKPPPLQLPQLSLSTFGSGSQLVHGAASASAGRHPVSHLDHLQHQTQHQHQALGQVGHPSMAGAARAASAAAATAGSMEANIGVDDIQSPIWSRAHGLNFDGPIFDGAELNVGLNSLSFPEYQAGHAAALPGFASTSSSSWQVPRASTSLQPARGSHPLLGVGGDAHDFFSTSLGL